MIVVLPEWNRHVEWELDDRNRLQAQMPSEAVFAWIAEFGNDCCDIGVLEPGKGLSFGFANEDLGLLFKLTFAP